MKGKEFVTRTLRFHCSRRPGALADFLRLLESLGAEAGEMRRIAENESWTVRDLTIRLDSDTSLERFRKELHSYGAVLLIDVRNEILDLHLGGKIVMRSRHAIESLGTLRRVYTPGVASVCMKIVGENEAARQYTGIGRSVAIVTDGTAILGLGDIGPVAGMPVMEGKAMLLDVLAGISGIPVLLDTKDPQRIVDTVTAIAPTFGAIQLEDISAPRCFEIEERLQQVLRIPVMHDDQHGTAVVTTAALMSICALTERAMKDLTVGQIGLGAAGMAITGMLMRITGKPALGADISQNALDRFASQGGIPAALDEVLGKADVIIATSGVPGLIKPSAVRTGQIVLALSNPDPEIRPEEALRAGAALAVDGRSVNNVLGFPGILRGALDVQACRISPEMYLAAAEKIAALTPAGEITPDPLDRRVHRAVARAVAEKAIAQSLAGTDVFPVDADSGW